jgi:hypothetical protein
MKCINCDTSNNLKDRTANMGKCKSCNHKFAFEPASMPESNRLTDTFFGSIDGRVSITNLQRYYHLPKLRFYLW